jgi:fatty acid desaturase
MSRTLEEMKALAKERAAARPRFGWAVVAIAVGLMWFVLAFVLAVGLMWFVLAFVLAAGLVRGCCGG